MLSFLSFSKKFCQFTIKPFKESHATTSRVRSLQAGMSLIEIIIVIALIGTVMTIVVRSLTSSQNEAMRDAAGIAMASMQGYLDMYRTHNFRYPTTEQGLEALVRDPGNAKNWRGPYLQEEEKLNDPWGQPFEYESEGSKFKMTSKGPDFELGTEDDIVYPKSASGNN